MVEALRALGHEVRVVSPPGIDPMQSAQSAPARAAASGERGVQSLMSWISRRLPDFLFEIAEIVYNVPAWFRLRGILKAERFDLIYERYAFFLLAGAMLARAHRIPFVLEANEVAGVPGRNRRQTFTRICSAMERMLFRRCSAIHLVSSNLVRRAAVQGVPPERLHVAPNAFDPEQLPPDLDAQAQRTALGLSQRTVIGFAGSLAVWDRLDMLIDAFAAIAPRHPDAALLIVGDGAVLAQLEAHAAQIGIADRVVFTGWVPRDRVYHVLNAIDIAVLPHSNEFGSPVVMFEFMGLRKPLILPRLDPITDVHEDGRTALVFPPQDRPALERALEALLDAPDRRHALAEASYRLLVEAYTWQRNARNVLDSVGLAQPDPAPLPHRGQPLPEGPR
jgi:glycosyltransferase involved in cell wall biosynthesis